MLLFALHQRLQTQREGAVRGEGEPLLTQQIASQYSCDKAVLQKVAIPTV